MICLDKELFTSHGGEAHHIVAEIVSYHILHRCLQHSADLLVGVQYVHLMISAYISVQKNPVNA